MFTVDNSFPMPAPALIQRQGKFSDVLAFSANLEKGQSFEAPFDTEAKAERAIRAIRAFNKKHGLSLYVKNMGGANLRVWCM
jgi:hypothetical protein